MQQIQTVPSSKINKHDSGTSYKDLLKNIFVVVKSDFHYSVIKCEQFLDFSCCTSI